MLNGSRATKEMFGSPLRSIETLRVVEKRSPILFTRPSLSVKQGTCFSSSTISFQLGARGVLGHGGTKATHSTESSLSWARPMEGSPSSRQAFFPVEGLTVGT